MSIYRRNNVYYCDIKTPDGRRINRSLHTTEKREAEEAHDKIKHELWKLEYLDKKPSRTWEEAAMRWLDEKNHKRSIANDARIIAGYTQFLSGKELHTLTADFIHSVTRKITNGKVYYNRHLALMRSIFNRAVKHWQWLDKCPNLILLSEPKKRIRFLTKEEARRLLNELPDHLRVMVEFSLYTGLRQANVIGLKWRNVDFKNRMVIIDAEDFKTGKTHSVPLNDTALRILRAQFIQHEEYVFTYKGSPVTQANTKAFRSALKRAGITNFRWHDLRHTWASWLIQAGVSLEALQDLGGWESREMVLRYAHLDRGYLMESIQVIDDKSPAKTPTPSLELKIG